MLSRISIAIMFLSNPGSRVRRRMGSRRDGPSPLGWRMWWRWSCRDDLLHAFLFWFVFLFCSSCTRCYRCYIIFYGVIASIQFCNPTYLIRTHFCTLVSASHIYHETPPTHPFLQPPAVFISKNAIFIPQLSIFRDFCRFFARKKVKY